MDERDQVVLSEKLIGDGIHSEKKISKKVKRSKNDVFFHFIMFSIGAYFSMMYTSWTSIHEFEYNSDDI